MDISYQNEGEYRKELVQLVRERLQAYERLMRYSSVWEAVYGQEYDTNRRILLEHNQWAQTVEQKQFHERIESLWQRECDIRAKAQQSLQQGIFIPLEYLFSAFGESRFLRHCVLLAVAREYDSCFLDLYTMYPESRGSSFATVEFCVRTFTQDGMEQEKLLQHFYASSHNEWELFFGVLNWTEGTYNMKVRLHERVRQFLLRGKGIYPLLKPFCELRGRERLNDCQAVGGQDIAERLHRMMQGNRSRIFFLHGEEGVGKRFAVQRALQMDEKSCLMVDAVGMEKHGFVELCERLLRETAIQDAGLCIYHVEELWKENSDNAKTLFQELLERLPYFFLLSSERWKGAKELPLFEIALHQPDTTERIALWQEAFRREQIAPRVNVQALAAKLTLNAGRIMSATRDAVSLALWEGCDINEDILYRACRDQLSHRLGEKATLVKAAYTWEDLILPPFQKERLKQACIQVEHHHQVYNEWGFSQKVAYGRGVSMLFYGAPGTGKTMAAQVIAKQLHLELYKVDLSSVLSKYIGEAEKSLSEIFEEVKKSQSILFFDEADALFGKRSETKDANDKYANAETAYLLQKIEEYEGIVILASNYMQNFDVAFKRRIKFMIEFSLPTVKERLEIWQRVFPPQLPMEEELDFPYLAEQFELSGSQIKNIAVAAAFEASGAESGLQMLHVLNCLINEVKKSGRTIQRAELGEYSYLFE